MPRSADSQSESEVVVSDPSHVFKPQNDDSQTLFKVIEITGERDDRYRVRWEGVDPETKKPWAQSWVLKRDCTQDLVLLWKRDKKEKERRKSKKSGRDSTASKRATRSVASTARTHSHSASITTSSNTKRHRNQRSPSAGPSNVKSKSKHPFEDYGLKEEDKFETHIPRDTKRKASEAHSVNSSVNQSATRHVEAVPVQVDSDGAQTRLADVIVSKPARKKRKVASEAESPTPIYLTSKRSEAQFHESHDLRNDSAKIKTPVVTNNGEENDSNLVDEEEDKMAKDLLLEADRSVDMNYPKENCRNDDIDIGPGNDDIVGEEQQTKDKGKGKAVYLSQEEPEEESDDVEIIEGPLPRQQLAQPTTTPPVRVTPSKRPIARILPQPPRNRMSPSSNAHERVASAGAPALGSKAANTSLAKIKKSKDSSFVVQPSTRRNPHEVKPHFEPDSDNALPPERHQKPRRPKLSTKPPRHEGPDAISIQDSQLNISRQARRRLAIFDMEVMGKKPRKKRVKEGITDASTSKHTTSLVNGRQAPSTVRPVPRFETPSYNMDVVPETEVEDSQENKLQPFTISAKSLEKRNTLPDVSPIDSSTAGPSSTKYLRPLPHISPAVFHPHLQPPNSSLPDTIVEHSSSHERPSEIEVIEQFESPEKERVIIFTKNVLLLNKNDVVPETREEPRIESTVEEVWESENVRHGQGLAEARRRRVSATSETNSSPQTTKKKSMEEVIARAQLRNRNEGKVSQPDEDDENEQQEEQGVADASTSVVPPASGPPAISQDPDDAMKNHLIDLDGGMDLRMEVDKTYDGIDETPARIDPEFLRQEEEESTQDLISERRQEEEETRQDLTTELRQSQEQEINATEGHDFGPNPVYTPSSRPASINRDTGGPNTLDSTNKLIYAGSTSRSPPKENQDDNTPGPITRSQSRSRSQSILTNRNNARPKKKALNIPSPIPSRRESPESPADVQKLQDLSTVLAPQISSLQTQVQEKQLEIDSLRQDLDSLREQLRSSEDQKAFLEADGQRQIAELKSQWVDEKSTWESDRTLLAAQISAYEKSRIQAEKDREFIREQYANASAYVTLVREENKELEERATIAEEQSKTSVEFIKTTFGSQVAKLQDEAKAWRRMAEFVMEKDIRTNDDIRRRAAEEPELRMLCVRQRKKAQAKIDGLQADLLEKSNLYNASTEELEHWKRENARLQSDLNEASIKLDRIGRSGDANTEGDGHEFVYRCLWRVETDNTQIGCPEVFPTMRELAQHIHTGHLER